MGNTCRATGCREDAGGGSYCAYHIHAGFDDDPPEMTFTCPDCGVMMSLKETFEICHHGRTDVVRRCGDCRSCSWCGETYDRANPCYTVARVLYPERNPDGSVCVQCFALTKGWLAVMQPDDSVIFTVGEKGHCAHIDCRREKTVVSVPSMRANEETTLAFCAEHVGWAQKRYHRRLNV